MISKVFNIFDLGFGNSGKGSISHKIAALINPDLILRAGGQGSHGVMTQKQIPFRFSNFGCMTLEHTPTALMPNFVMSVQALLDEANALREKGIVDPFKMIFVDPQVIIITPFHRIAAELTEMDKYRDRPSGSLCSGAGEALFLSERDEALCLRARDLSDDLVIEQKLTNIIKYYTDILSSVRAEDLPECYKHRATELLNNLQDPHYASSTFLESLDQLREENFQISPLAEVISNYHGAAIIENSHGVLADRNEGFQPHIHAMNTLPQYADSLLRAAHYTGEIVHLGVTRAYTFRQGGSPLPVVMEELSHLAKIEGHLHKDDPEYIATETRDVDVSFWDNSEEQVAALDFTLLKWAINICSEKLANSNENAKIDGICVTWVDQVMRDGEWIVCTDYNKSGMNYLPIVTNINVSDIIHMDGEEFSSRINPLFEEHLGVPVVMISTGTKDNDKVILQEEIFRV